MPKFVALVAINVGESNEATMQDHLYNHILPTPRDLDWVRVDDDVNIDLQELLNAEPNTNTAESNGEADNARDAIVWATETFTPGKAGDFLKLWLAGDFEAVKEKYPETPDNLLA